MLSHASLLLLSLLLLLGQDPPPAACCRPPLGGLAQKMASYKFYEGPLTVESPHVRYTDTEILADYEYETVTVDGGKVGRSVR